MNVLQKKESRIMSTFTIKRICNCIVKYYQVPVEYGEGGGKGGKGAGKDGKGGKGAAKDGKGAGQPGFGKDGIPDGKLIVTLVKVRHLIHFFNLRFYHDSVS